MNNRDIKYLKYLCKFREPKHLANYLIKELQKKYKRVYFDEDRNYVMAVGCDPVCLVAHMDDLRPYYEAPDVWIHDREQELLYGVCGAGFDDKAGIFAILKIISDKQYRPTIVFTNEEEHLCMGAREFIKKFPQSPQPDLRCIIELDRRGKADAVFYGCDNDKFKDYILDFGFNEKEGSYTDISFIAPAWDVAAVNFSIGYENEHSMGEYLDLNALEATICKTKRILNIGQDMPAFRYDSRNGRESYRYFF